MSTKGLIHIYYGDGKGKTTAALGLAMRAAGCGKKVVIAQFLKNWKCGEHNSIRQLANVTLLQGKSASKKFVRDMSEEEKQKTKASLDECLRKSIEQINSDKCDVLILDEVIDAYNLKVLDADMFEDLVFNKSEKIELVITGHKPNERLLKQADYVTEMVKRKHPYDEGVIARQGIEF